ncbi:proline-rich protein 36-like [Scylla paramamosain]|uniref:proline-rich protein 36-like n=1 Tax=Scylla paramamosain TaxID=85552 RepID=UPI00308399EC
MNGCERRVRVRPIPAPPTITSPLSDLLSSLPDLPAHPSPLQQFPAPPALPSLTIPSQLPSRPSQPPPALVSLTSSQGLRHTEPLDLNRIGYRIMGQICLPEPTARVRLSTRESSAAPLPRSAPPPCTTLHRHRTLAPQQQQQVGGAQQQSLRDARLARISQQSERQAAAAAAATATAAATAATPTLFTSPLLCLWIIKGPAPVPPSPRRPAPHWPATRAPPRPPLVTGWPLC